MSSRLSGNVQLPLTSLTKVGDSSWSRSLLVRQGAAPVLNQTLQSDSIPEPGAGTTGGRFVLLRYAYTVVNHPTCVKDRPEVCWRRGLVPLPHVEALGEDTTHNVGSHSERPVLNPDLGLKVLGAFGLAAWEIAGGASKRRVSHSWPTPLELLK